MKLTDNRFDNQKRSYAFNLGSKVVDAIYNREHRHTSSQVKKQMDEWPDVTKRYMLEAFMEGYIIAKEKSEERIIWDKK